jgi:hypothetical protein
MSQMNADKSGLSYLRTSAYICGFIIASLCPLSFRGFHNTTSEASTW